MVMHIATRRVLLNSTAVRALSGAGEMLRGETQGLSLSFTDDHFLASTSHYGSARVKDTGTPANNYNSHPFGLLTYASPNLKLCRGPDGLLRYGAHNLALNSAWAGGTPGSSYTPTSWLSGAATGQRINLTSTIDPADTAIRFVASANRAYLFQIHTVVAGQVWELSFDAETISQTGFNWQELSNYGGAVSASIDYNGETASGSVIPQFTAGQRVYLKYTIISGGSMEFRLGLGAGGNTTGDITISRPMLRRLPTVSHQIYLRTTSAARYELPYEWDIDGNLLGVRVEEQQRDQLYFYSNLFDNTTTGWSGPTSFTITAVNGTFAGIASHKHTNIGEFGSRSRTQLRILGTSTQHTISLIVENVDAVTTDFGLYDRTSDSFRAFGRFTWATGAISAIGGTLDNSFVDDLGTGPNGGALRRISIVVTTHATNTLYETFIYPTGAGLNTLSAILHHAQLEPGAFPTSPIISAGSTVTRAADVFGPPLAAFPWNGGVGTYEVDGVSETPTNNGTILTLAPRNGQTHIRTVKWVPSP